MEAPRTPDAETARLEALGDLALLQHELQSVAAAALNRELARKGGLRLASPRRATRIVADAMAAHLAGRLDVVVDLATKRIDVRWPQRRGQEVDDVG